MPSSAQGHSLVEGFFHRDISTFTDVVYEGEGGAAAIIDPVLDCGVASVRTSRAFVDAVPALVENHRLQVEWILETHAHAGNSLTYVIGDGAFVGDNVFAPGTGTGRTEIATF